jgi:CsoR family transcriptional regulator, copper-sensing transcriptional repressor
MLDADTQERVTLRLRRIEGQVRGLIRMVKGSQLCVDLLTQITAAQAAMKSVGDEILHHHVRHCVPESFGSRRLRASEKARLEEMEKIFVQYCKEPQRDHEEHVPIGPVAASAREKARKRG